MAKPDFTGIWKFNRSRSSLQIPAPDSTTFVIEHREPRFHLSRTHVVGGHRDTLSLELTTDGALVVCNHGGLAIQAPAALGRGDAAVRLRACSGGNQGHQ